MEVSLGGRRPSGAGLDVGGGQSARHRVVDDHLDHVRAHERVRGGRGPGLPRIRQVVELVLNRRNARVEVVDPQGPVRDALRARVVQLVAHDRPVVGVLRSVPDRELAQVRARLRLLRVELGLEGRERRHVHLRHDEVEVAPGDPRGPALHHLRQAVGTERGARDADLRVGGLDHAVALLHGVVDEVLAERDPGRVVDVGRRRRAVLSLIGARGDRLVAILAPRRLAAPAEAVELDVVEVVVLRELLGHVLHQLDHLRVARREEDESAVLTGHRAARGVARQPVGVRHGHGVGRAAERQPVLEPSADLQAFLMEDADQVMGPVEARAAPGAARGLEGLAGPVSDAAARVHGDVDRVDAPVAHVLGEPAQAGLGLGQVGVLGQPAGPDLAGLGRRGRSRGCQPEGEQEGGTKLAEKTEHGANSLRLVRTRSYPPNPQGTLAF